MQQLSGGSSHRRAFVKFRVNRMESAQAVHNVVHTVGGRETDMYVAAY